ALQFDGVECRRRIVAGPMTRRDRQSVEQAASVAACSGIDRRKFERGLRQRRGPAAPEACQLFVERQVAQFRPWVNVRYATVNANQRAAARTGICDGIQAPLWNQFVSPEVNQLPLR